MNGEFPLETAGEGRVAPNRRPSDDFTIPGGDTVWIQTVNSIHQEEADTEANIFAAVAARRYKKGGEVYDAYRADFENLDIEGQVSLLLEWYEREEGWRTSAFRKFLPPPEPSKTDEHGEPKTDIDFIKEVEAHENELDKVANNRVKHVDTLRKAKDKQIRSWTANTRVDRCMDAFMSNFFHATLSKRLTLEIILRSVRCADNHSKKYFTSIDDIRELDDDVRQSVIQKYNELDAMKSEDIPTSPAG